MTAPGPARPTVGLVTDPSFLEHASPGHPERPDRLAAVLGHLEETGLQTRMRAIPVRDATDAELLAVHTPELLAAVAETAERGGWMDADTYVNPDSPAIARRAAGGVLMALEAVLEGRLGSAFAAVRPPGHHATGATAMGFCLYNHAAVAAAAALRQGLERIAILDWDVHHGNGTQEIFESDPRVFYASTHAYPFYPGSGHFRERGSGRAAGTKLNVPLPPGAGDEAFEEAYARFVFPALERFEPQLLLVSSGWDAHARDPLAPLEVTTAGYTRVARDAIAAAGRLCDGRLLVTLEGGYDTHALAWCAGGLVALMLGDEPAPDPEPVQTPPPPDLSRLFDAIADAFAEG